MSSVAIRVEGLGKKYRLGAVAGGPHYKMLRESMSGLVTGPLQRLRVKRQGAERLSRRPEFWAVHDVSFELQHGEVLGIIGRNGAGKSTLLKLLSRITEPTRGRIGINGRVASLLEVGSGFHPELTGRENIFLNGAILGMSRIEIARKFDEIVAFAEVEKFIDTQVKHYSSGMYLRLAFAVAAHLEPEILIVDEVLAVGDMSFQRKCLNKMEDVGQSGRTVLFVSHNMPAITRLCGRVVLLDQGMVLSDGPSHQVVSMYLSAGLGTTAHREWPILERAPGDDVVRLRSVRVRDEEGATISAADIRRPVGIDIVYDVLQPGHVLVPGLHFWNEEGTRVFATLNPDPAWRHARRPVGCYTSTAWIPGNLLAEGSLIVEVGISTLEPAVAHVHERDAVAFEVIDSLDGDSVRGDYGGAFPGVVRPLLRWATQIDEPAYVDPITGDVGVRR